MYRSFHYFLIIFYSLDLLIPVKSTSAHTHLETANKLLLSGKYNDALPHFHEAIGIDPSNYLTYFKRATVFLALNRPKSALEDFDKAIELNENFTSAFNQRAGVHVKLGNLDEAQIDYERVLVDEQNNHEILQLYGQIESLKDSIKEAQALIKDNQYDHSLIILNAVIEKIPWNTDLLRLRASAFEKVGEPRRAINDLKNVAKLTVDAITYLNIARLCFKSGDIGESLNSVRECLKLDPDNKACKDFYKPTKKLSAHVTAMLSSKNSNDNDDCVNQAEYALNYIDENNLQLIYSIKSVICHCLAKALDVSKAVTVCDEALSFDVEGIEDIAITKADLLCDKADILAEMQQYSDALKLFQESKKLKSSERARQGIEKMNKLKKQKAKRDYYKILGVNRSSSESDINRAYRKLAAKWHPDRFQDEADKKKAQAKFMDIADAKAVLTDPKKRKIYDAGEDPLDPESKHGSSQHHGFYGDPFSHFGGGPFQFKFSFK